MQNIIEWIYLEVKFQYYLVLFIWYSWEYNVRKSDAIIFLIYTIVWSGILFVEVLN